MTAPLLALLASIFYGASDFCGGMSARRLALPITAFVASLGALVLLVILALLGGAPHLTNRDMVLSVAAGLITGVSLTLLYWGLARGPVALVAPLTALAAAGLPVIYQAMIERIPLTTQSSLGVGAALVAVFLLGLNEDGRPTANALPRGHAIAAALVAGGGIAAFYILMKEVAPGSGAWPLVLARAATLASLAVPAAVAVRTVRFRARRLNQALAAGAFDALANTLYVLAVQIGSLAVAATLSSLYPVTTVLLGVAVLHERLTPIRIAGLIMGMAAALLFSA